MLRIFSNTELLCAFQAVENAVQSADRYYRLTANGASGQTVDPERMANAFKVCASSLLCVSLGWLPTRNVLFVT